MFPRREKSDGIFCVDIGRYPKGAFNLMPVIVTRSGLGTLFQAKSILRDRQIYVYPDSRPIVGILVGYASDE